MKNLTFIYKLIILPVIAVAALFVLTVKDVNKKGEVLGASTTVSYEIESKRVDRVAALTKFFQKYRSPLAENAETFVQVADKYGMDFRLLPAISCMESTCAKHLIEGTYNPFGWGIYGDNYISFSSYDDAIETVGEGIYDGYISKGLDEIWEIAPVYTPPNSINWRNGVGFFMSQISDADEG
jgi:hypothetical protein